MFIRALAVAVVATTALAAQSQSGNIRDSVITPQIGGAQSIAEQFVGHLKIDPKDQGPAVDEILLAAMKQGAPIAQELLQARQGMVNAALRSQPEDMKQLVAAYSAAEMKMAALESQTFMKVYGVLKPNQQPRAAEAFQIMAGIFLPAPPPARRAPQGPRTGGGGR